MKLSDGEWRFFYGFGEDGVFIMRYKVGEGSAVGRCAEAFAKTGRWLFPVMVYVPILDRVAWMKGKEEHLAFQHKYSLKDIRILLGLEGPDFFYKEQKGV